MRTQILFLSLILLGACSAGNVQIATVEGQNLELTQTASTELEQFLEANGYENWMVGLEAPPEGRSYPSMSAGTQLNENASCQCGDINSDGRIAMEDIVAIVNYIFGEGASVPLECADVDGVTGLGVGDLNVLLAFIFEAGPAPSCGGAVTPTPTPTSTSTPTPTPTATPTPTPTSTPTPSPTPTPVPDSDCTIFVNQNHPNATADTSPRSGNSASTPYRTIRGANQNHIAGDVVCILPGTYRERLVPISGPSNSDRTVFKGVGNRNQVLILGSDFVSGWSRVGTSNIYRAPFNANTQRRSGGLVVPNTNCWVDRTTWLLRGALTSTGDTLADLNQAGEFFYDANSNPRYLYVWMPNGQAPAESEAAISNKVECSKRPVLNMGETSTGGVAYTDSYTPTRAVRNFTLENLTIMQTHNRGISLRDAEVYSENITINNIELAFTTGGSYAADNPAAIIHPTDGYCNGCVHNFNVFNSVIRDVGSDHGPISDPRIDGATHRGAAIETYGLADSTFEGNTIYNAFESIFTKNGNVNITIRNNVIHDVKEGIGIGTITAGPNYFAALVEGNIVANVGGWGISSRWGNAHTIIRNNTVFNAHGGIAVDSDRTDDRHGNVQATISNNIISSVYSAFGMISNYYMMFLYNSANASTSDYNLFYDPGTLDGFAFASCDSTFPGGTGCITVYSDLNSWDNTGKDVHSRVADPMFLSTNPSSSNFLRPASGSPACTMGSGGTRVGALTCN